ncbi:MAG: acyl-CoA dehydrogenase family protein, partial [Acidobacteriota bacterium]|nr:acyl-CoA dehydrogenase family protein [Acidobacteriota bacterium]
MTESVRPLTDLTEEQQMLVSEVRRFCEEKVQPKVAEMDREAHCAPEILEQMFEMGLMGIDIPEAYGGSGMSFFDAILVIMELAKVDPSISVICDVQNTLVNNAIQRWGNEEQRKT